MSGRIVSRRRNTAGAEDIIFIKSIKGPFAKKIFAEGFF